MPIRNFINADTVDGFHASQTPSPNTIPVAGSDGKLNSNWISTVGLNADTVDGFHASITPAPNVIVPLDANGVLDLSATSALINAYTIRRINGNSLTSDYFLAVGEEAIYTWDTTASLSKPLYIATTQGIYLMVIQGPYQTSADINSYLNPNNTTYTNAFTFSIVGTVDGASGPGGGSGTYSAFLLREVTSGISIAYISTYTTGKFLFLTQRITRNTNGSGAVHLLGLRWNDTTTAWTSLGTLTTTAANGTVNVLVRRLV